MMRLNFHDAQQEIRSAYVLGAPGVLVSGLVWLATGVIWGPLGPGTAFALLFVGGLAIFPLSLLIARVLFRAPAAAKTNPLNRLGFETTVPLFAGLLVALMLLERDAALGLALFAAVVGARYFAFATLYRDLTYWALGAALLATGYLYASQGPALPGNVALCVGAIELGFAAFLFARWRSIRG